MKKITFQTLGVLGAMLLLGAGCNPFSFGSDASVQTTGPAGMFVSNDRAETWKSISIFPQAGASKSLEGVSVYKLYPNPQNPNVMYWASRGNGLFYTKDRGQTWQLSPAPLNTGFIYSFAINPKDECILYATDGTKIYQSTNCNTTWTEIYREPSSEKIVSLISDPFAPARLYMLKSGGDLFVSTDMGLSWGLKKRFDERVSALEIDPFQEGILYVSTQNSGLYRSDDSGKTWTTNRQALSSLSGATTFRRFVVSPTKQGVVYWISDYGILVSSDHGDTWSDFSTLNAPGTIKIYTFVVNPKNDQEIYYTGTIENRSVLYKTINGGKDWITKRLPSGQIPTALLLDSTTDGMVYLGLTIPPK
jgi:photosystem II stability/assembly factor-like uncharacterized protein